MHGSIRRWCVSDPLPPSANLPLVRGRRERSERGGRSHTILIPRLLNVFLAAP